MKKTAEEKDKFVQAFEKEFDDKVISFELAEFNASSDVFEILKLIHEEKNNSIWGLAVFCEKENYFYSFPQENFLSYYVRKSSGLEESASQCISFTKIKCHFSIPKKKFFDFLFPRKRNVINGTFLDEIGISRFFELYMNKKAADIIKKIHS